MESKETGNPSDSLPVDEKDYWDEKDYCLAGIVRRNPGGGYSCKYQNFEFSGGLGCLGCNHPKRLANPRRF